MMNSRQNPKITARGVSRMRFLFPALLLMVLTIPAMTEEPGVYIKRDGSTWTMGTTTVERVVALEDGKLILKQIKDKESGQVWAANSPELSFAVGSAENRVTGASSGWSLLDAKESRGKQGEVQLDLRLRWEELEVTKSYVLYPDSSIIREWVTFKNTSPTAISLIDPAFLNLDLRAGEPGAVDFHWMTGGENQPGSWDLRTETLSAGKARKFDSYEPFPLDRSKVTFLGDGIKAKVLHNETQVWPANDWKSVADATVVEPFDTSVEVAAGDKLVFLVNMNREIGYDTTAFDPVIAYADGETHQASKEFSGEQGKNGWHYQYLENGKFVDLVYYEMPKQWRKEKDNTTGTPFVGISTQHPDTGQDAARVWVAPKAGRVHITGSVCNIANGQGVGGYGFRPGTSTYAPWYALYNRETRQGAFVGWDYFGHWTSSFEAANGAVATQLAVAGYKNTLEPGQSVRTPKAFVGLFHDDLDNAGNACLDWQYQYLWDYTREGWFPAIRMLGYWMKGTGWGQPGVPWTGGKPDLDSAFRKVFRVADLMRYTGADVYHRDWGWWDRAGDWNGPDFKSTIDYLGKHGMGQLIYAFLYTVDLESKVAKEHPDWLIGNTLDMSKPEVVEFMKGQLDGFVARWGQFEWRNDSFFTAQRDGDDTAMPGQDEGLRQVISGFLDKYPHCAFQAVNGGGNYGGYDYVRYASTFSFSDGAVGILRNYYASLLFPPDKTSDIPDVWNPDKYDKGTWRGLLCINFDMTGDTWDSAKLEGLRELIDIYHYLQTQGVVGRWVHVYRPIIEGDDPTMYLQRLSRDGERGILIPKRPAPGPVTIRPKGLRPEGQYIVSFHESDRTETREGGELMNAGIRIESMSAGELIYLNLPMHPGSKLDKDAPTPPSNASKQTAKNMGFPGVEVTWKAGSDNNWVSGYEILRDGVYLDKASKGTFYFDHSAGADLAATYEIRTIDGAGNVSTHAVAEGAESPRAQIIDDAMEGAFVLSGNWTKQTGLQPAHGGSITASKEKGSVAELGFDGTKVRVFSKLGADCGTFQVRVDEQTTETVDTYSADDIWGACVYEKDIPAGKHTLRIEVTGEHSQRATDSLVHLDGVRVETK